MGSRQISNLQEGVHKRGGLKIFSPNDQIQQKLFLPIKRIGIYTLNRQEEMRFNLVEISLLKLSFRKRHT